MYDESIVGAPIRVGDTEVILVEDSVGSTELFDTPILLEDASDQHPTIWIDETRIAGLREKYPDTPIFGLWQTLYHNNLVTGEGLEVVLTGETSGYFLLHVEGNEDDINWNDLHVESGEYLGDRIASYPAFVPSRDGRKIELDLPGLLLPEKSARLMSELLVERRIKAKALWASRSVVGAVAAAIIAGAYGINAVRDSMDRERVDSLKGQLNSVQEEVARLESGRLAKWPTPFAEIAPFVLLLKLDQEFRPANGEQTFNLNNGSNMAVVSSRISRGEFPSVFQKVRRPDGLWEVSW